MEVAFILFGLVMFALGLVCGVYVGAPGPRDRQVVEYRVMPGDIMYGDPHVSSVSYHRDLWTKKDPVEQQKAEWQQ